MLAAIPVKPFGVAKARLAGALDARARSATGRAIAERTATLAAAAGAHVAIVTGDPGVARWAAALGHDVIGEGEHGHGLDGAALAATRYAAGRRLRWAIVHADLPLVTADDLRAVFEAAPRAIAPSHDGGTNVITGSGSAFPFSYGPGSFHRHLAAAPDAVVISRPGLAHDLDTPADLRIASSLQSGAWLAVVTSA